MSTLCLHFFDILMIFDEIKLNTIQYNFMINILFLITIFFVLMVGTAGFEPATPTHPQCSALPVFQRTTA